MKRAPLLLVCCALAAGLVGCTKRADRKVLAPDSGAGPGGSGRSEIVEARWLTQSADLTRAVQTASVSPLVRAALAEAPQTGLRFVPGGAAAAIGLGRDGARYRVTILPYANPADPNRATFLSLLDRDGAAMCERSELLVSVSRVSPDSGFVPITIFGRLHYLRVDGTYIPAEDGTARLSPTRFNRAVFIACFWSALAVVSGIADRICSSLPEYPQCSTVVNTVGAAAAAIGCGIYAFTK